MPDSCVHEWPLLPPINEEDLINAIHHHCILPANHSGPHRCACGAGEYEYSYERG